MPKRNSPNPVHKKKNAAKHVLAAAYRRVETGGPSDQPTGDVMVADKIEGGSSPVKVKKRR